MKIKELRKRTGLTQIEVAEKLNLRSTGVVSMWENGKRKPRTDKLPELAKVLGCSIDELYK